MWFFALVACSPDRGCLHRDLDDWCLHEESEKGPTGEGACEPPQVNSDYRCGDYDVASSSGGFTSESFYFDGETGSLVAVAYGTDVNSYCGGFVYWYGKRVDCEPECAYGAPFGDLPLCQ